MTRDEYAAWRPDAVADYADHHIRAGSMLADRAHAMAEKQFADLLPDGPDTAEHHLLVPEHDGGAVGFLWLHIPAQPSGSMQPAGPAQQDGPVQQDGSVAFVYDVQVDRSMRGRGLGRSVMLAGEDFARGHGAASMRLHVFGDNSVARRLYQDLGYAETNVMMAKSLDSAG